MMMMIIMLDDADVVVFLIVVVDDDDDDDLERTRTGPHAVCFDLEHQGNHNEEGGQDEVFRPNVSNVCC